MNGSEKTLFSVRMVTNPPKLKGVEQMGLVSNVLWRFGNKI